MTSTAVVTRAPYQGARQILSYNRQFYLGTLAGCAAALIIAARWLPLLLPVVVAGAVAACFWMVSSLVVSHWVYDRSKLYRLGWVRTMLPRLPARWINIHAGLDETSGPLSEILSGADAIRLDIYDPREMTEPSIAQARAVTQPVMPALAADFRALPFVDHDVEAVFLFFTAHELRREAARAVLFQEVARVLAPGGTVLVVEHLRDFANFCAFGPGFLHFLPRSTWLRAAAAAQLQVVREENITPFVRVFAMWKPG